MTDQCKKNVLQVQMIDYGVLNEENLHSTIFESFWSFLYLNNKIKLMLKIYICRLMMIECSSSNYLIKSKLNRI